jgi:hypothetical protein
MFNWLDVLREYLDWLEGQFDLKKEGVVKYKKRSGLSGEKLW